MQFKRVKIVVYTPLTHADEIRGVLAEAGVGHIGNYSNCSFSSEGVGRFKGDDGADPYIGGKGRVERVKEERIEAICEYSEWENVLKKVKRAHPYEEPAIDVVPLLN